jgi:hypothetical protein
VSHCRLIFRKAKKKTPTYSLEDLAAAAADLDDDGSDRHAVRLRDSV